MFGVCAWDSSTVEIMFYVKGRILLFFYIIFFFLFSFSSFLFVRRWHINMVLNVHRTLRLIRDGEKREEGGKEVGKAA